MENLIIIHGGGPTAVLNNSLYGAITTSLKSEKINKVFGAYNGVEGVLNEEFIDFTQISNEKIEKLKYTPGTALGSSRYPITDTEYRKMVKILEKHNVKYVLFNGGNGTMTTCGKFAEFVESSNSSISTIGIPKTMDNDIAMIDHSPGFGSAARYVAELTNEIGADVKSLPIHVSVLETMGRDAGWIAASSALSPIKPDLIYLPEIDFNEDDFLKDVERVYNEKGSALVVVSEGLKNEKREPIVPPVLKQGKSTYYGDVSSHLVTLIIDKLGIKARSEKPGLAGRTAINYRSPSDIKEAIEVGVRAVEAALNGESNKMVGIVRTEGSDYSVEYPLIPISKVVSREKMLPLSYINEYKNGVTEEFIEWCTPLIGGPIKEFISFNEKEFL